MMHILNYDDARVTFQKFLDDKKHWCLIAHHNRAFKLFERLGVNHFALAESEFPCFQVKHISKGFIVIGFASKARVSTGHLAMYLTEFGHMTTEEELQKCDILPLSATEIDGNSVLFWFQKIVGEKYFV